MYTKLSEYFSVHRNNFFFVQIVISEIKLQIPSSCKLSLENNKFKLLQMNENYKDKVNNYDIY